MKPESILQEAPATPGTGKSIDEQLALMSDQIEDLGLLFKSIDHNCGDLYESTKIDAESKLIGIESIAKRGYREAYAIVDAVGKLRKAQRVTPLNEGGLHHE